MPYIRTLDRSVINENRDGANDVSVFIVRVLALYANQKIFREGGSFISVNQ